MKSTFMRYPEGKAKAVTFSYDDGVMQDKRLSETFNKYGMKGTFNFNSQNFKKPNFSKEEIQEYFISKGHEIAVHGAYHRANGNLRAIDGIRDVIDCRLELEERCDCIIRGMAYPDTGITLMGNFGNYQQIKNYLTELDIAYARTLGGDNDSFMLPQDFHAWMPTAHHNNPKIMEYIDKFLNLDISMNVYHARRIPRLMYIWGHSYEFDNESAPVQWEKFEEILANLYQYRDGYWAATNLEIYDYVQAMKKIRRSADGKMLYNPTDIDVWVSYKDELLKIGACQTVVVE